MCVCVCVCVYMCVYLSRASFYNNYSVHVCVKYSHMTKYIFKVPYIRCLFFDPTRDFIYL